MSQHNKEMVRNTLQKIWNRGDFSAIENRFSSDYVGHSITPVRGPEGARQFAAVVRGAFSGYRYTVEDEIGEGDRVVHRWTATGIHEDEFQGIPATGKEVKISGMSIYRVADGKFIEGWTTVDMLGVMRQLGAVPPIDE